MLVRSLLIATSLSLLSSCSATTDDIIEKADNLFKQVTGQPDVIEVEDRTTSNVSDNSTSSNSTEENIIVADNSAYTSEGSESQSNSSDNSTSNSSSSTASSESLQSDSTVTKVEVKKVVIIEKTLLDKLKDSGLQFTLYFSYDGFDIDDESTKDIIEHANFMRDNPGVKLRLEGHADERGTREYNLALGENRALSVKEVLGLYDLSPRIDVVSYGEEKPISTKHDESAWKKNRRVEFIYQ
jgi:peptidoglycan-associated lipoprotein